ncbi:MAG: hypothetical protein JWM30_3306 [Burkholderia sp.]|jgi:hypothetical protein|nr:hypothetical protein [Burkholderia sp.]
MDIVLIELVLWAGLIFFLWVLKDTLGNFESEIDRAAPNKAGPPRKPGTANPERLYEPIGSYGGTTIFRYAVIDGERYEFDYASGGDLGVSLAPNQRTIAPGLVYSASPGAVPLH